MAKNLNSTYTCECESTVTSSGRYQHLKTNKHRNFIKIKEGKIDELIPRKSKFVERTIDELPDLNKALRYSSNQLRTQPRVLAIQNLRGPIDLYTKADIILKNGNLSNVYEVDHIHEVQVFVYAIHHVPQISFRAIEHLRIEINSVSNLVITDASVNKSKGQAIKLFLNQLDTSRKQPLIAALVQAGTGGLRQIAGFSAHIVGLINDTQQNMSDHIRTTRRNDGHVAGNNQYGEVADQFDSVVQLMELDYDEPITLRSGRVFHPPPK